jgi:hypothetical protein
MSQVRISGNASGTGIFTVDAPNTNTNYTLTLPTNTGTLLSTASGVAVNGPTFAATKTGTQSISSGVWTKLTFPNELFDPNSNYDTGTSRFTPTVAGYYQIQYAGRANEAGAGGVTLYSAVYKNNTVVFATAVRDAVGQPVNLSLSGIVSMNGTTDYLEIFGFTSGGTGNYAGDAMFSSALVRAA